MAPNRDKSIKMGFLITFYQEQVLNIDFFVLFSKKSSYYNKRFGSRNLDIIINCNLDIIM